MNTRWLENVIAIEQHKLSNAFGKSAQGAPMVTILLSSGRARNELMLHKHAGLTVVVNATESDTKQ